MTMQTYITNLAKLFRLATGYTDSLMTNHLANILELSMRPKEALEYWRHYRKYFATVAKDEILDGIEDYLTDKARD